MIVKHEFPPSKALGRLLVLGVFALNLLLALWCSLTLYEGRQDAVTRSQTVTQNLALSLDQSLTASAEKIDLTLRHQVAELEDQLRLDGHLNLGRGGMHLQEEMQLLPELSGIRVSDASGRVIMGSDVTAQTQVSWADRDFFRFVREHADVGLYVTKPIFGRVGKIAVVAFIRRYNYPDGRFAGIVSGAVPLSYFEQQLSSIALGPSAILLMRDLEGGLVTRYPASEEAAGQLGNKTFSNELRQVIERGIPSGSYHVAQAADGVERINNFRRIKGMPFYLIVGQGSDEYLAAWRVNVGRTLTLLALFALISSIGAWLLWRSRGRIERQTRRKELLLRGAGDGIHILDERGIILEVSDSFARMLGRTRQQLLGRDIADIDGMFDPAEVHAMVTRNLRAREHQVFQTRHRRCDGSLLDVEVSVFPLEMDGQPVIFASSRDITERQRAEAEIKRSAEVLRGAIDAIDEAFVLYDPRDRLVLCNDKYRQIYAEVAHLLQPGTSFESIIRAGAEMGQYSAAIGRVDAWVQERMKAHLASNSELIQRLENGRVLRIIERKLPDGHIVGFRIDITELVRATEAAQQANLAKSRFLATMSHEIRTPMNGILGMAQLLIMPGLTETERDEYTRTILSSGQTLLVLLNDILDLSKIEAGKLQLDNIEFAPAGLLAETRNLFSGAAQAKGLQLALDCAGLGGQRYQADAHRLRQMLSNLAGNAIKFTSDGSVALSATELSRQGDVALLEFAVSDTGKGIAPDKLDLLFKPFSQTDNSTTREYGGSGLGLSIVAHLAQAMGGEVGVSSQVGQGSRFWFRIRAQVVAAGADAGAAASPIPAAVLGAATNATPSLSGDVLVVEDNPVNRMFIKTLLTKLGLRVSLAVDGQKGLDAVTQGATPDLILMDINMPVMDGRTATQRIRAWEAEQSGPRLPIIALTADAFAEDRQLCLDAGMDDFLTKPVEVGALQQMLRKWLAQPVELA